MNCVEFIRRYTVNEVISMIEDDQDVQRADIYIDPPSDGIETDEESGNEDEGGTFSNLSGRQLRSSASVTVETNDGRQRVGEIDSSSDEDVVVSYFLLLGYDFIW